MHQYVNSGSQRTESGRLRSESFFAFTTVFPAVVITDCKMFRVADICISIPYGKSRKGSHLHCQSLTFLTFMVQFVKHLSIICSLIQCSYMRESLYWKLRWKLQQSLRHYGGNYSGIQPPATTEFQIRLLVVDVIILRAPHRSRCDTHTPTWHS